MKCSTIEVCLAEFACNLWKLNRFVAINISQLIHCEFDIYKTKLQLYYILNKCFSTSPSLPEIGWKPLLSSIKNNSWLLMDYLSELHQSVHAYCFKITKYIIFWKERARGKLSSSIKSWACPPLPENRALEKHFLIVAVFNVFHTSIISWMCGIVLGWRKYILTFLNDLSKLSYWWPILVVICFHIPPFRKVKLLACYLRIFYHHTYHLLEQRFLLESHRNTGLLRLYYKHLLIK